MSPLRLASLALIGALFAACAPAGSGAPLAAGASPDHTISVSGTGTSSRQPDTADLRLGFSEQRDDAETARSIGAATVRRVIEALTAAGVAEADIRSESVSLSPAYDYIDGKSVLRGFDFGHVLAVTVRDLDTVGALIDAAVGAGANRIDGIGFRVADPSAAADEARAAAMADARAKAEALAREAGVRIIGVASISEGVSGPAPYYPSFAAGDVAAKSTQIMPGSSEVGVTLTVVYLID